MEKVQSAADLEERAKAQDIGVRTLRRAEDELGIAKRQSGFHGGWWWGPEPDRNGDHRGLPNTVPLSPEEQAAEIRSRAHTGDRDRGQGTDSVADLGDHIDGREDVDAG